MATEATPERGRPEILAPAGGEDSFLAALAAGADAIYLGLKNFSARMEAENFGLAQLARLTDLAHAQGARVHVAMNSLIKPGEISQAARLASRLATQMEVDGLIIQDPGMIDIARQAGFGGQIALSTLANITHPAALRQAVRLGASRIILPRELSLDEMRLMGDAAPPGLELECFVQGALCYCVSGRCYWSSYMGGKSGLRGRCVQPCRRLYTRGEKKKAERGARLFSCQDLELASLAKALLAIPNLVSWKIEGRKKGPHYVFHAVSAYRLARDNPDDPQARADARELLARALGRPGVKARLLGQKNSSPLAPGGQTSSGRFAGLVRSQPDGSCFLRPQFPLLPNDLLRIGVEDERWHSTLPVSRAVPKGGSLRLNVPKHKTPKGGVPVYLIDRREPELQSLLAAWRKKLRALPERRLAEPKYSLTMPEAAPLKRLPDMKVRWAGRTCGRAPKAKGISALWLDRAAADISRTLLPKTCFWLPPVVWPDGEESLLRLIERLWRGGARHFVCNAPWQRALFPDDLPQGTHLVAGPFCNAANSIALETLRRMGFSAAFASPELSGKDLALLARQSPLPLGLVTGGYWPLGLSRFGLAGLNVNEPFRSPRGEVFWARDHGGDIWIYPAWPLDLKDKLPELSGFAFFAELEERPPAGLAMAERPGLFNWDCGLL